LSAGWQSAYHNPQFSATFFWPLEFMVNLVSPKEEHWWVCSFRFTNRTIRSLSCFHHFLRGGFLFFLLSSSFNVVTLLPRGGCLLRWLLPGADVLDSGVVWLLFLWASFPFSELESGGRFVS
jgi:hypothetical protein